MSDTRPRAPRPALFAGLLSSPYKAADAEIFAVLVLTLVGALIRFWLIGSKGLWYDEALTALMAGATPHEIVVRYSWDSAFAHPPLWLLFMRYWVGVFGKSEAALRLPAALAGALVAPLLWQVARTAWPTDRITRLVAVGLVVTSPILVLYSQEARMYSAVTLLAVASVYLTMRLTLAGKPAGAIGDRRASVPGGTADLIGFVLVNWVMLGLHYYSAMLIGIEAIFLIVATLRYRRSVARVVIGLGLSVLPFLLWAVLAPGFRTTLELTLAPTTGASPPWYQLLSGAWKDLAFGSIRWQPQQAVIGYLLLPLLILGILEAVRPNRAQDAVASSFDRPNWGGLFVLIVVVSLVASLMFGGDVATRYVIWVSPFVYLLVALAIGTLWRLARPLGAAAMILAGFVAVFGLCYYFIAYQKSEYREMSAYLASHAGPDDAVILEAPRQYLLAKYYLSNTPRAVAEPSSWDIYPMPPVTLPEYWPVTAPPVVPEEVDHQLQMILDQHGKAWLVLAGEDEVDPGEFVGKYLTAISYPQDCWGWLDVRLCAFVNPKDVRAVASIPLDVAFAGGMGLRGVGIGLGEAESRVVDGAKSGDRYLYVSPQWHASITPASDYKVTLRLLGPDGTTVSQSDSLPIGPLLPPTTWNAGDDKPGFMVLRLPKTAEPVAYQLAIGLYDPLSSKPLPFSGGPADASGLLRVAQIRANDEVQIDAVK